ncbi:MAG: (d)CMP kinase [Polyangiaceae bacterium]|nr:(d)CMP kinase [Polyangiaceae bacterium]
MLIIITIDGPAGAGKSTVARALATRLHYVFLDTGAIYRTLALACRRSQQEWDNESGVCSVARDMVQNQRMRFVNLEGGQRVILDNEDVSEAIREPDISAGASKVSAHAKAREVLLSMQRDVARHASVVVEGRDTGTVVFPDALVKFFITATPEQRARRRCDELIAKGTAADYEETVAAILERDARDEQRAAAPLRCADDAIVVNTTTMTVEEVVGEMLHLVQRTIRHRFPDLQSDGMEIISEIAACSDSR